MLLRSPVPIVMPWGEAGVMLCNDACSVFAGGRHPQPLGSNMRAGWSGVADLNDHVARAGLAGRRVGPFIDVPPFDGTEWLGCR